MISKRSYLSPIKTPSPDSNLTVTYINGSEVLQEKSYTSPLYAEEVYLGDTPTKPAIETERYDFIGWNREVDGYNIKFTAQFKTVKSYVTQWVSNGTVLQTSYYFEGDPIPSYIGSTPTKTADTSYKYVFSSWSSSVSGNTTTYTAVFTEYARKTVIWMNGSTTLQTSYYYADESEPSYTGSTPTKASTSTYRYTFSSWSASTSGNTTTYTAQFTSTRYYTWERYNVVSTDKYQPEFRYNYPTVFLGSDIRGPIGYLGVSSPSLGASTITISAGTYMNTTQKENGIYEVADMRDRLDLRTGKFLSGNDFAFSIVPSPSMSVVYYVPNDYNSSNTSNGYLYPCDYLNGQTGPNWPTSSNGSFWRFCLDNYYSAVGLAYTNPYFNAPDCPYSTGSLKAGERYWHFVTMRYVSGDLSPGRYSTGCVSLQIDMYKWKTTYSKGTTQYSNVTSTSSTTYPSNGASGSYWYVKIS